MDYTEKMKKNLNELITKNIDSKLGYEKAAEMVENDSLKRFFNDQAALRFNFVQDLKNEVSDWSGVPNNDSSLTGSLHRTWMNIKTAVSSNDEQSILEEVLRGENVAIDEYDEVMNDITLPPTTKNILAHQKNKIRNAIRNAQNFEMVMS